MSKFVNGDILTAKLPLGYYGAIRILKAWTNDYTQAFLKANKWARQEGYLIAFTQYFDKEKPLLSDPRLKQVHTTPTSDWRYIYNYCGYEYSDKMLEKYFTYLGNLPLDESEQKLHHDDFYEQNATGITSILFETLAPPEERDAYNLECEAKVKREAYRYLDDESDNFFWIQYGGSMELTYLTGKTGTRGRGEFEEFITEEACVEEAQKLIAAKIKEGYVLADNYYQDDRGKNQFDDGNQIKSRQKETVSIHQVFRYTDEKSDKFWRIEYLDDTLVVNYGKTGSIGKYQIKEFDDEEECEKEAKKLIASKLKKGYKPYLEFDINKHLYFDDPEIWLHRLTSHPKFREHFTDDLYYDCTNEFAPFGSDEGDGALNELDEHIRRAVKKGELISFISGLAGWIKADFWDECGLTDDISHEAVKAALKTENGEMDLINSDMTTYSTAFALIKIIGRIDAELKRMALISLKRIGIAFEITGQCDLFSETQTKMIRDLEEFTAT